MNIHTIQNGLLQENCYIVYEKNTGVIIDPGGAAEQIIDFVNLKKLDIKYILLTHGHFDHIGALYKVKQNIKAQVGIHKNDSIMLNDDKQNLFAYSKTVHQNGKQVVKPDIMFEDDMILPCGQFNITVLHTPGHSQGSCCFVIDKVIFTGDTLFAGSIGRTDFPGGNYKQIIHSIKNKLLSYDDEYLIYPGHGQSSTIGKEKHQNVFII